MPRYLLARPRGGLNDQLVQIEACWRYAERHERTMILDTTRSGIQEDFFRYFEVRPEEPLQPLSPRHHGLPPLEALGAVQPAWLQGRVSTYEAEWLADPGNVCDEKTGELVTFDHERDHPEDLLVHEQCGGGRTGVDLLARVRLAPQTADAIAGRLRGLPSRYAAVHIRDTDVRADLEPFLERIRRTVRGGPLVVCSDNRRTLDAVRRALGRQMEIRVVSDVPDLGGHALHERGSDVDRHATNLDLLTDLLALAGGRPLHCCPTVDGRGRGYATLARLLGRQHRRVRDLLEAAEDQETVRRLFSPLPPLLATWFGPFRARGGGLRR